MKTISIYQPWATLIILGLKQYETRDYPIAHRGPLAVHAAKNRDYLHLYFDPAFQPWLEPWGYRSPDDLPLGAVLGTVNLLNVYQSDKCNPNAFERAWGDWSKGRFVWKLDLIERFAEPVPAQGQQGLWEWDACARTVGVSERVREVIA
jgi:hypothetical protein